MLANGTKSEAIAIRMLGPFQAFALGGRQVLRPGRRSIALLACLAVDPDTVWTRDRLAGLLWGRRHKEQARASLRQELVRLQHALGRNPITLDFADGSLRLRDDELDIDVVRFRSALVTPDRLTDAATLYRGDLLEGLDSDPDFEPFGEWLGTHRCRLRSAAVQCLMQLLRASIARSDDARSTRLAERALAIEPACEEAHQWLICSHAARHDLHAALNQFRACREALRAQDHVEPSPDTCNLVDWIKATLRAGLPPVADRNQDQPTNEIRSAGGRFPSTAPSAQSVQPVEDGPSMAVLPFVDLSAGHPDEALVDGLTEEAIAALAQIPGLYLAARHSVMAYKGSAMDVRQIAAELGVKYALEASIRRDRMQLYANLRLIDGQTGLHLWAETFNTPLSDLMSVRNDFIRQSVIKLQPYLQANVSHHTSYPQPISQLMATLESMLLKKGFGGAFAKH